MAELRILYEYNCAQCRYTTAKTLRNEEVSDNIIELQRIIEGHVTGSGHKKGAIYRDGVLIMRTEKEREYNKYGY